jgi:hypothetical protein
MLRTLIHKSSVWKFFLMSGILTTFFVFLTLAYENKIFSIQFVDEDNNFVLGKFVLNGEKLYSDLFTQHQPMGYILSAAVQKVTQPNSIPQLIKRHREIVLLWSVIWAFFLTYRFGPWTLLFIMPYEMTKHALFGNLFLSETFTVYPLMYLTLLVLIRKKMPDIEHVFAGLWSAFLFSLLLPLWPLVTFLSIMILIRPQKARLKKVFWYALGFGVVVILVIPFVDIGKYFFETILFNVVYFIPQSGSTDAFSLMGFVAPVLYALNLSMRTGFSSLIQGYCVLLIIGVFFSAVSKSYKTLIVLLCILGLSYLRFVDIQTQTHNEFHVLPWFGLILLSVVFLLKTKFEHTKRGGVKISSLVFVGILVIISFMYSKDYLLVRTDQDKDVYVNFSKLFDYGEAVRIMKTGEDTLFVAPDMWLIYWQGNIPHASVFQCYYAYMANVPFIRSQVDEMFITNPPPLFYYDSSDLELKTYLSKYIRLKKDEHPVDLYILKEKYGKLTSQQLKDLEYYRYGFL